MKSMKAAYTKSPTTWLRTDQPVIPINAATWNHLPEVESALRRGVEAIADTKRPGFYEIEIGETWYYVHVPSRLRAVYLVAAQNRLAANLTGHLEHQPAC
jgi:hypothetical protein